MKKLIDIHNHTIASGHAYSSLQEMVQAAAWEGIEYFGITDHAPSLPGAPDSMHFRNFGIIPREMYGVKLLMGCELNILDSTGKTDLDEHHYSLMDIRLAGIHKLCWSPGTKEQNTEGVLNVMHNKWVNVITHPGDGTAELDFEPLVLASRETGTVLEINSSSLIPYRNKTAARPNNIAILRLCQKHDVPVIISSDAHISFSVGDYRYALPLLDETGFPEELVLNNSPEEFFAYTGIAHKGVSIRRSTTEDIPRMQEIFATARKFMAATGNPHQWGEDYPEEGLLREDIARGDSYVCEYGGKTVGTFVLRPGDDPTYSVIYEGSWPNGRPYSTIHRIASSGEVKGLFPQVVRFALRSSSSIRIDTHKDNVVMKKAILREGFRYCGIIRCWNGSERLAYQYDSIPEDSGTSDKNTKLESEI